MHHVYDHQIQKHDQVYGKIKPYFSFFSAKFCVLIAVPKQKENSNIHKSFSSSLSLAKDKVDRGGVI